MQNDWAAGMVRAVARHLIPEQGVYDLRNYLLDEDGMPYKRGGTVNKSNAAFGSSLRFLWDGHFDAGPRTLFANTADFGVLASDDATPVNLGSDGLTIPKVATLVAGMLFIDGGYVYAGSRKTANYTAGTVTTTQGSNVVTGAGTAFLSNVDPGMLFQVGDERVYVVDTVDSDTQFTLRNEPDGAGNTIGYTGTTGAGKSYTLRAIYKITAADPYKTGDYYAVVANRLIVASDNVVEVSEVNKPHDWTATIGGVEIPTRHELADGAVVMGLATVEQTLLVFTTKGMWAITGLPLDIVDAQGDPQHQVSLLSRDFILLNPQGIATWNQTLVVPASDGIYLVDGISEPREISRSIERLYREYVRVGYRTGQAVVSNAHYFLPIMTSNGVSKDVLVCRLDRPFKSRGENIFPWSRLSGQPGEAIAFTQRVDISAPGVTLFAADSRSSSRVLDCSRIFAPGVDFEVDADGSIFESDITTRDYETGNLTENMVRSIRVNHQLIDPGDTDPVVSLSYASDMGDPDAPYWGHPDGEWGAGFGPVVGGSLQPWTHAVDSTFQSLCQIPEDYDGTDAHSCRVNKSARFIRFRLRSNDPCAVHRLRMLELAIRPSRAIRR